MKPAGAAAAPRTSDDARLLALLEHDEAYRVWRVLAEGPTGTTELVWLGEAGPLVRKRIPVPLANVAAWRAASASSCPRLPRVRDLYELPDELVVVSDYVAGESLEARLARVGRLGAHEAARVAREVCEAAGALHALGVVHRDITPGNVVLAADGAHLVDLGIARVHAGDAPRDTTALGTWGFAAPEQFGFAQTDARSDVYAIGCLLGCMLAGARPGESGYAEALADAGRVPPALASVVRRACAFEPSARYATAGALSAAITGALGAEARPAPEVVVPPTSPRPAPASRLAPATPRELAAALRTAPRRERGRARGSLAAGLLLLAFWLLVTAYGVTDVIAAPTVAGVASVGLCLGIGVACGAVVGWERAAARPSSSWEVAMRSEWDFIRDEGRSVEDALALACPDDRTLPQWIASRLEAAGLRRSDVVRESRLNQTFCYQIIAGTRRASRDKLLQLAFGMRLGVDDACELLERGGAAALRPFCARDVVVAFCLERHLGIDSCDDLLWSLGESTLVSPGTGGRGG